MGASVVCGGAMRSKGRLLTLTRSYHNQSSFYCEFEHICLGKHMQTQCRVCPGVFAQAVAGRGKEAVAERGQGVVDLFDERSIGGARQREAQLLHRLIYHP